VVRCLEARDIPAVEAILTDWLSSYSTAERAKDEIEHRVEFIGASITGDTGCRFLVAEDDAGEVVGIMGLQGTGIAPELLTTGERVAELTTAYLRRDRRGAGAGRALADEIEARATELGFTTLVIVSGSRNEETGYPFWQRRYGDPIRRDDDYWAPGAERVVWKAELPRR
jgi:L-amino acid N-acyltransferase YncA